MKLLVALTAVLMVTSAFAQEPRCGCNKPRPTTPKQTAPAVAKKPATQTPARQCAAKPCPQRPAGK